MNTDIFNYTDNGSREENCDSCHLSYVKGSSVTAIVSDGSGFENGKAAADMAAEGLGEALHLSAEDIENVLRGAFERLSVGSSEGVPSAACLLVSGNTAKCAAIGSCGVFYFRNGKREQPAEKLTCGSHAFLICTDGLCGRLFEEEIMLDLNSSETAEQWIRKLRIRAEKREYKSADNNTAVAVFIEI